MVLFEGTEERESGDVLKEMTNVDVAVKDVSFLFFVFMLVYTCVFKPLFVSVLLVPFLTFITHPKKKKKLFGRMMKRRLQCVNHAGENDLVGSQGPNEETILE